MKCLLCFVVALSIACLFGCAEHSWRKPPSPGEGFVAFDSPRDFDAPGQVYRVDKQKNIWRVGAIVVTPKKGQEHSRSMESKANWSLQTMLKTIGVAATQLPGSAQADISRSREVTIEGTDITREWIDDTDNPSRKVANLLKDTEYRPSNKYYLIRETQAVNKLNFRGSRKWLVDLKIEAELQKQVSGKGEYKVDNQDTYSIVADFKQPMRVWYKAERIEPTFGAAAEPSAGLSLELKKTEAGEFKLPAKRVVTKP